MNIAAALDLHRRVPVIDGHADSILMCLEGKRTLSEESHLGHLDWPRAKRAGLTCTVQAAWPSPDTYAIAPRRVGEAIDGLLQQIQVGGPDVRLALTAADIWSAHAEGGLAVLLNVEGAEGIQGSLALLRNYYRLGVRMMGLVWNHRNEVADGAAEFESDAGLTRFGREVVREMNRLGMLVDLAHITPKGFFEVLSLSTDPVLFTHGNCRALRDHARNLTDEQIRALAAHGGLFGISFVSGFVASESPSLKRVADHIDHAVQLLGSTDHVALGSDFDGCTPPPDLAHVGHLPDLTVELAHRGYAESDLAKILGGNYLRLFERVLGS
jgi:membrane dipeptidase